MTAPATAPDRLYRCRRCADAEFVAASDHPACPECGGTLAGGSLVELVVVHFDPPTGELKTSVPGVAPFWKGENVLACDPKVAVPGRQATGVPSAVTCPRCKETQAYQDAARTSGADPRRDVPARAEP